MESGNGAHFTPEQLLQATKGRLEDGVSLAHLEVCLVCAGAVDDWRTWLSTTLDPERNTALPGAGEKCLSSTEIAELALSTGGDRAEQDLPHVASCGRCAGLLREAMNKRESSPDERAFLAALNTASAEWQHRTAVRYSVPVIPSRSSRQWLALAAGLVAAVGLAAWWMVNRNSDPEQLLARAYTASRPFEYRLPDAGYAPVRQSRSAGRSAFDLPSSLTSAVDQIQKRLSGGKEDGPDLFLKGRAELLENQYDAAIESFTRGLELKPNDAAALTDLGCAYALRGDAEKRNLDYGHAIDLFAESLRIDSAQPRAIFNSALVFQKLWLIDEAVDAWDRYLKLDSAGEWASEGRRRREELEKIRDRKKAMMELPKDPRSFLARLDKSPTELEPELYLEEFWTKWLPDVRHEELARQAAEKLGDVFVERFHDESLREAVHSATEVDAEAQLAELGQLITDSVRERNDAALREGLTLIPALAAARQRVAKMRAELEVAYAYGKATDHERCLALLKTAVRETDGNSFPWMEGVLRLQDASCAGRAAEIGSARAEIDHVRVIAEHAGLRYLALRATIALGTFDQLAGNAPSVWESAPGNLALYWSTGASDFRAQQLIHDMRLTASALNWKECAIILDRATLRVTAQATVNSRNRILEALNRSVLSGLLQESGYSGEAVAEVDSLTRLLNEAEPGPTLEISKLNALLQRATIQAKGPSAPLALQTLDELSALPESSGVRERMLIYQARGLAQKSTGDLRGAEDSFRESIRLHNLHLASLAPAQRLAYGSLARDSYRNLTELRMNAGDITGALSTWEAYRSQLDGHTYSTRASRGAVGLVYAVLPSGIASWISDSGGIDGRMIPERDARAAEHAANALLRIASSPKSDVASLNLESRKLRTLLLGNWERRIPFRAKLQVEADDWVAEVPFGMLSNEPGRYPAAEHSIVMVSGLGSEMPESGFSAGASATIVSVTSAIAPEGNRLPILEAAHEEGAELAQRMPRAVLLTDGAASTEAIVREIPRAEIFHFAGHGWANGGNAGLLLGSASGAPAWIDADEIATQDWKRCRLAVLSACLTATGEEHGPVNNRSLVRALLSAGVRQVIAARWSVDTSATRALMHEFYGSLFAGASPAEALAAAESRVSAMSGWSHPYYWAGFDVFGPQ